MRKAAKKVVRKAARKVVRKGVRKAAKKGAMRSTNSGWNGTSEGLTLKIGENHLPNTHPGPTVRVRLLSC